jgi:superfamily II DNA or RNA helicase
MADKNDTVKRILAENNINKFEIMMPPINEIKATYYSPSVEIYQLIAAKYILREYLSIDKRKIGRASCIVKMGTGMGKTHLAMQVINMLKVKTVVVLPPTSGILVEQWLSDLREFMSGCSIGVYNADRKDIGADILVIMVNNLMSPSKELTELMSTFTLVIYDELHSYATNKRFFAFTHTSNHYRLGMTATFEESPAFTKYLEYELGDVVDAKRIPFFKDHIKGVKFSGTVSLLYYHGDKDYTKMIVNEKTGTVANHLMYEMFSSDPSRNQMCITIIKWLLERQLKTFIFFNDKESIYMFERLLIMTLHNIKMGDIVCAMSGMNGQDRSLMYSTAKIILVTYAYCDTGVSVNDAYSSIYYHPRKTLFDQKNGRIFRLKGDIKQERYIFDIIDAGTLYLKQLKHRRDNYVERGLTIHVKHISPDTINNFSTEYLDVTQTECNLSIE